MGLKVEVEFTFKIIYFFSNAIADGNPEINYI
jgi:hypothetical protein